MAIKIVKKESDDGKPQKPQKPSQKQDTFLPNLSKEVKLLMRLNHPNIIKLHQVIDTAQEVYIVMDYASGGELIDYIAAKGNLDEKEGRRLYRQILSALDHCHLAGVVHRDLKLENLLLSSEKNIILSDFGLGRMISGRDQYLDTFCGTPLYAAPELVSGIKYYGPTADIWSTGIVLFLMIAGKPPFVCDNISDLYRQIKTVRYTCPPHFSRDLQRLLGRILMRDPQKRITMDELRVDAWVNINERTPPDRVMPKIVVAAGQEITADQEKLLVPYIEKSEEYTAFVFGDVAQMKLRQKESAQNTVPPPLTPSSPTSPTSPDGGLFVPKNHSRRASSGLLDAISRFNPFQAITIPENDTPAIPAPISKPQLQKSAAPPKPAIIVISESPDSAIGKPQQDQKTNNHQRRHSISPGAVLQRPVSNGELSQPSSPLKSPSPAESLILTASRQEQHHQHDNNLSVPNNVPIKKAASSIIPQIAGNISRLFVPSMNGISEDDPSSSSSANPNKTASDANISRSSANRAGHERRGSGLKPIDTHSRRPSIIESMGFHTHSGYSEEMRSLRYSTAMHTTTAHTPSDINVQLEKILNSRVLLPNLHVEKRSKWVWVLKSEHEEFESKFVMEIEVCSVWLLKMSAIKMKRLGGDAMNYKNCYDKITSLLGW